MKTFYYPNGREAGETLTVWELIRELKKYPPNIPVMAEWEGCKAYIRPIGFAIEEVSMRGVEGKCECLVIDVNDYL